MSRFCVTHCRQLLPVRLQCLSASPMIKSTWIVASLFVYAYSSATVANCNGRHASVRSNCTALLLAEPADVQLVWRRAHGDCSGAHATLGPSSLLGRAFPSRHRRTYGSEAIVQYRPSKVAHANHGGNGGNGGNAKPFQTALDRQGGPACASWLPRSAICSLQADMRPIPGEFA